jgi:sugar-specific transcriptional regulator TrmB
MAPAPTPRHTLRDLIEKGYVEPVKRGRPPLYATDEERRAAKKAQQQECVKRHAARVREAKRLLKASLAQDVCVQTG